MTPAERLRLRQRAEAAVDRLILLLDAIDGDADFEDVDEREPENECGGIEYPDLHNQTDTGGLPGWRN